MATPTPPFLEPIEAIRNRLSEMESAGTSGSVTEEDLEQARLELQTTIDKVFATLTPWQKCQLARHPDRPYTMAYIHSIFDDFVELRGDRRFADDAAVVAGLARFEGDSVVVVGHQKGRDTSEKLRRNFGMPRPEGYRKALRIMQLAAQFKKPIISFVDTPGAYPGIDAEQRGQAEAIARNLIEMANFPVPIIIIVTGEGGSGGALALGIGDRVLMLSNAIYSVISPEGCAAILWKDQARAEDAASALRLTATDLKSLGVIDEILEEPPGGAHMDPGAMADTVRMAIRRNLKALRKAKPEALVNRRYKKFRSMGIYTDR
jgi:acetyl-CoA carboxylase carboxyl transferase subunit alpha